MVEYRVNPIERYEVTRYSEVMGSEVAASNLTKSEADDIAGAMFERANSMGMAVKATYASGQTLDSTQDTTP